MGGCASAGSRATRSHAVPMSLVSSTTRCRRASKRVSDLKHYKDAMDSATAKMVPAKMTFTGEDDPTHLGYGRARNSNLLFLPDLHSLNLFKGQLVP
jgi:hypothetical protein